MLFALLAKFLISQSPAVQASALGLCTGLFVTAAAEANDRDPVLTTTVVLILVSGTIAGVLFYLGLAFRARHGWTGTESAPVWLHATYAAVWSGGLVAAVRALLGDGGVQVALLTVVPLVLLAPTALEGFRALLTSARVR
jgi:hypothetical protein